MRYVLFRGVDYFYVIVQHIYCDGILLIIKVVFLSVSEKRFHVFDVEFIGLRVPVAITVRLGKVAPVSVSHVAANHRKRFITHRVDAVFGFHFTQKTSHGLFARAHLFGKVCNADHRIDRLAVFCPESGS